MELTLKEDTIDYCLTQENFRQQIGNLEPNSKYSFQVTAYTAKGQGEFSDVHKIETEPQPPTKPLQLVVTAKGEEPIAVSVSWKLPNNGTIDKYR